MTVIISKHSEQLRLERERERERERSKKVRTVGLINLVALALLGSSY